MIFPVYHVCFSTWTVFTKQLTTTYGRKRKTSYMTLRKAKSIPRFNWLPSVTLSKCNNDAVASDNFERGGSIVHRHSISYWYRVLVFPMNNAQEITSLKTMFFLNLWLCKRHPWCIVGPRKTRNQSWFVLWFISYAFFTASYPSSNVTRRCSSISCEPRERQSQCWAPKLSISEQCTLRRT